jgi:hypothetical protein
MCSNTCGQLLDGLYIHYFCLNVKHPILEKHYCTENNTNNISLSNRSDEKFRITAIMKVERDIITIWKQVIAGASNSI